MSLESRLGEITADLKNATKELAEVKEQQKADHDKIVVHEQQVTELVKQRERGWQAWLAIAIAVLSAALSIGSSFMLRK